MYNVSKHVVFYGEGLLALFSPQLHCPPLLVAKRAENEVYSRFHLP
jgi:hypothetical protein